MCQMCCVFYLKMTNIIVDVDDDNDDNDKKKEKKNKTFNERKEILIYV